MAAVCWEEIHITTCWYDIPQYCLYCSVCSSKKQAQFKSFQSISHIMYESYNVTLSNFTIFVISHRFSTIQHILDSDLHLAPHIWWQPFDQNNRSVDYVPGWYCYSHTLTSPHVSDNVSHYPNYLKYLNYFRNKCYFYWNLWNLNTFTAKESKK